MFIKKLTLTSVLLYLVWAVPTFSFAAISAQEKMDFKNRYGSAIPSETYTNILNFCDKNNTDLDSCLAMLKANPAKQKSAQSQMGYSFCCRNVSGGFGDYVVIHQKEYCIPPCD
ncbi:MAG: hypothetical protein JJT82_04935 [Legionellaceae bacterium]|nr:hypothetical protein [Legionellaceae bacterium]